MSATFELRTDELTPEFIESLKALAYKKTIKIELLKPNEEATEYLFSQPSMRTLLERRMEDVEAGRNIVMPPQEEFA
ncbi:MAG: hypothetical protein ACOVSW_11560 [Candidatus Kapaibacteriota bacterium]